MLNQLEERDQFVKEHSGEKVILKTDIFSPAFEMTRSNIFMVRSVLN